MSEHVTAAQACTVRLARDYSAGFDEAQRSSLKSRKTNRGSKDETTHQLDYWKRVYRILFPDVEDTCIPSPCE